MRLTAAFLFLWMSLSWPMQAQEATVGISVPFTITGGLFRDSDGDNSAGYRAVFYTFKAGQLTSAFGSFPIRYDDMANPLIDQPLAYRTELKLSPAQHGEELPCHRGLAMKTRCLLPSSPIS